MRRLVFAVAALAGLCATAVLAGSLEVTEHGVGTAVEDRVLQGEADSFAVGTTVYYWTRVVGGRSGDRIRHVWIHDGAEVSIGLALGGPHWRTYSSKRLDSDQVGDWVVEARDADDGLLSRREFRCTAE